MNTFMNMDVTHKLKNRRYVASGRLYNAYFAACDNDTLGTVLVEKKRPFGLRGSTIKEYTTFPAGEKTFAVVAYDHFNGHFGHFSDPSAIFGLRVAEVVI